MNNEFMQRLIHKYFTIAYLFLIAWFILHEVNANYGLVETSFALSLFLRYLLIGAGIHLISYFFLKNLRKAALFSFITMVFVLFFGAFHDGLKRVVSNIFFKSHTFMFSLIGILSIIILVVIKKYLYPGHKIYLYFGILISLLLCVELVNLSINVLLQKQKQNDLAQKIADDDKFTDTKINTQKPDIFYIVFDSYTSSESLLSDFNYSNAELDSFLEKKGFFISRHANSNYPITPFSVASALNMNYLDSKLITNEATAKLMLQGVASVYKSKIPQILKDLGYEIYNYSVFNLKGYPAASEAYFKTLSERLIDEQTLVGRFKHYLLWNFTLRNLHGGITKAPKILIRQRDNYIKDYVTNNLDSLESTADRNGIVPKFVYCHIMLPHEPYYYKRDGNFWPDSMLLQSGNPKEKFLEQTIYSNSVIERITNILTQNRSRPYVIILQGDHGFRDFDTKLEKNKIFKILNTYYFSDRNYDLLYDSISPVNSFRVVLNKYFDQQYKLLADSSVYIKDPSFNIEKEK
jgi:hypothetical protein